MKKINLKKLSQNSSRSLKMFLKIKKKILILKKILKSYK